MYSRWGIYHYTLETVGREEVVRYFRDLKGILSPAGEIRSDFFYLEDHEIAASGFDVIAITGKLGTKMYPIKDKVENIDVTNDETRDTSGSFTKGGIDLNPALLDLQIKRDGNGVPLLLPQQPIETMRIDGFVPIIINITPISDLLLLLGLEKPDDKKHPLSSAGGDKPAGSQIKPFLEKLPKCDASILCAAHMASPKVSAFVTWNTRDSMAHGVSSLVDFPALVPADCLILFRKWV
jgi:hypothetical protein